MTYIRDFEYEIPQDVRDLVTPLIEACGLSQLTSFRSFEVHTQAKNRLYFLKDLERFAEEMGHLSFDESLKLEQHIRYCQSVLSQLDIYNTIDQPLSKGFSKQWRKYYSTSTIKDLRIEFRFPKKAARKDEAYKMLEQMTYKVRHTQIVQRLHNAMRIAHEDGWYFVFDTLTLSNDRIEAFYNADTALRDYFRNCSRAVLRAEKRKVHESSSDCYQYFCVPEYGAEKGRLHFHVIHMMRTLPNGVIDPNHGRRIADRRQLPLFSGMWEYGHSMPIAVRYSNDKFTRDGWRWPTEPATIRGKANKKAGQPVKCPHYEAVAYYVSKYVSKSIEQKKIADGKGTSQWNNQLTQAFKTINPKLFRVRMSRSFGLQMPDMTHFTEQELIQLMRLDFTVSRFTMILKHQAKKTLKLRLGVLTIYDILECKPKTVNLLAHLRLLIKQSAACSLEKCIDTVVPKLTVTDISDNVKAYISDNGIGAVQYRHTKQFGAK
ncbi:MAG: replication initiator protein [Microviridae sp.]|nr:MAG: replication initiator protein [Microviridae sp.]